MERQNLIVDADDTLWENCVYFEDAFADFVDYLEHSSLNADEIRGILDEIELANARVHGYGSMNFGRNLQECYLKLAERAISPGDLETVKGFALRILEQPLELFAGVEETLAYLSERHDLTLFTKGNAEEQKMKIDRSGLGPVLRPHRHREGEERRQLSGIGELARHLSRFRLDDRQLA